MRAKIERWRTLGLAFGRQAPQKSGGPHVKAMRRRPALNFAASPWDLSFFAPAVVASLARCNRIALRTAPRRRRKNHRCRDPHEFFNSLLATHNSSTNSRGGTSLQFSKQRI